MNTQVLSDERVSHTRHIDQLLTQCGCRLSVQCFVDESYEGTMAAHHLERVILACHLDVNKNN